MSSEEAERDDVDEIEKDSYRIGYHIDKIRHLLGKTVENNSWRETIIENEGQVDHYRDGQVEPHAIEKKEQSLAEWSLVEKLQIEQIEQPATDAERQQTRQQPVNKQYGRRRQPFLSQFLACLVVHAIAFAAQM